MQQLNEFSNLKIVLFNHSLIKTSAKRTNEEGLKFRHIENKLGQFYSDLAFTEYKTSLKNCIKVIRLS